MMMAVLALSTAACGADGGNNGGGTQAGNKGGGTSTSTVANKDKPLVWFNRQPSNSSTGELDMTALNFNKDTYYVGFDANQGAELQGTMVKDYIEKNIDKIDRNEQAGGAQRTAVEPQQHQPLGQRIEVRVAQEIEVVDGHHAGDLPQQQRQGQFGAEAVVEVELLITRPVNDILVLGGIFGQKFGKVPGVSPGRCGRGVFESDFHNSA